MAQAGGSGGGSGRAGRRVAAAVSPPAPAGGVVTMAMVQETHELMQRYAGPHGCAPGVNLSVRTVAAHLGCSPKRVKRLLHRGAFPGAFPLDRDSKGRPIEWRIPEADVVVFKAKRLTVADHR